jgi:hypothetical protein
MNQAPALEQMVQGAKRVLPFERVALVLQGGGALGAYQAGVYQAIHEANIHIDWVCGTSIGRHQRRAAGRQSAGAAGGTIARILGSGHRAALRRGAGQGRDRRSIEIPGERV